MNFINNIYIKTFFIYYLCLTGDSAPFILFPIVLRFSDIHLNSILHWNMTHAAILNKILIALLIM